MKISKVQIGLPVKTALTVLSILMTVSMIWGCGKKGPPVPPTGSRTPSVTDLVYEISQNTVNLSWTIPQSSETAQLPITGFLIYRSQQSTLEAACPNCPIRYKNIGDVPAKAPGYGESREMAITYTETIESGYRYIYMVQGYSTDGIRSKPSNIAEFIF